MSKKNSKLGSFTKRLKGKFSGLFKKSASSEEDLENTHDIEDEFYDEEYEGEYSAEGYEDEEFEEDTNPSFQPLTVNEIKKQQVESGEIPPDLPDLGDEDDEDYSIDGDGDSDSNQDVDWEGTSPSLSTFDPNHNKGFKKDLKEKLTQVGFSLKQKLTSKSGAPKSGSGLAPLGEKLVNAIRDINIDEIFDRFFSPQQRPRIHKTFLTILFIASAYLTGRLISGFLSPMPNGKAVTKGTSLSLNQKDVVRNQLNRLKTNDLFQAPDKSKTPVVDPGPTEPTFKEVKVCRDADNKSSLGLKLMNTVILQDEVKSLASVQMRGKENFLRVGDSIPNTIEVGKITREKLIFKNLKTRKCEYIENAPKKGRGPKKSINIVRDPNKGKKILKDAGETGITNVGNTFKIKKEVRARMLENISEVLTQARAVQIKNPDGSLAFRMQEIVPGSIYSQLNIQEGDVITGINGKKITNMAEMMNLFGQIDKVDHFELTLSRNGMEQNLEYDFE